MKVYALLSDPVGTVPWQDDCATCRWLVGDPEPGLLVWIQEVCEHFDRKHDAQLTQGPPPPLVDAVEPSLPMGDGL